MCGESPLEVVLDYGPMPLVDRLAEPGEGEDPRHPLVLARCDGCGLLQAGPAPDRAEIFGERYRYLSSCGDAIVRSARAHARELIDRLALTGDDLVLEIACNDGTQLAPFAEAGVRTLGYEPAPIPAEACAARGIPVRRAFFDQRAAAALEGQGQRAALVIAKNVLAHVDDPVGLLRGVERVLDEGGLAVFEFGYARDLVERGEFDIVYHEHQCYLTVGAVRAMLERAGLALADAERIGLHGGSLRVEAARGVAPSARAIALLRAEEDAGVATGAYARSFADQARAQGERIRAEVERAVAAHGPLTAYGAAAKGAVLLNHLGLDRALVARVVDRNPHKRGRLMPGTRQPVVGAEVIGQERPAVVLLLAWNFAEEVAGQQRAWLEGGGRLLVPLPEWREIGAGDVAD